MKRFVSIAPLLLLILSLAGCGSSSQAPATTTVKGIASKGPIVNGIVKIYSVVDGKKGALLNQGKTDDKGSYNIDIGTYTGPVMVEASGDYTDEATGTTKTISAESPLRAALASAEGTVSLPVTPLTELAVIKMGADLSPAAISAANTLVSDLFKVDIITTQPVLPTTEALKDASQAQKDYTLALAAVSQMMLNSTATLGNTLNTVAQSISPTTGMAAETVAAISKGMTDFVANNANNLTGITDTSTTSLVNVGTLTKSYKLYLQGAFTPNSVTGIQFNLSLPGGVTINTNSLTSAVLTSSLTLTGTTPSGALLAARYSAGVVTAGILSTSGITAGEIATLTCNIPAGMSAPGASSFSVTNLRSIDKNAANVTGTSITIQ